MISLPYISNFTVYRENQLVLFIYLFAYYLNSKFDFYLRYEIYKYFTHELEYTQLYLVEIGDQKYVIICIIFYNYFIDI